MKTCVAWHRHCKKKEGLDPQMAHCTPDTLETMDTPSVAGEELCQNSTAIFRNSMGTPQLCPGSHTKNCEPKMAQINIPFCKKHHFPLLSLGPGVRGGRGGGGGALLLRLPAVPMQPWGWGPQQGWLVTVDCTRCPAACLLV